MNPAKGLPRRRRWKFVQGMKETISRSFFMGKSFGTVGLIFSAVECTIEKFRAKHDLYNSASGNFYFYFFF
jgi:mitochondrial import inner membrane translocase subunit TIM22